MVSLISLILAVFAGAFIGLMRGRLMARAIIAVRAGALLGSITGPGVAAAMGQIWGLSSAHRWAKL